MHSWSFRVASMTVPVACIWTTNVVLSLPKMVKQVLTLPPELPVPHLGPEFAKAAPAPTKSAIVQTDTAIRTVFRRVSFTKSSWFISCDCGLEHGAPADIQDQSM